VAISIVLALSAGCAPAQQATWWIEFDSTALGARASLVEASVIVGGCSGDEVVYSVRFAGASAAVAPPTLAPGSYGFAARARDASCRWYAAGCADVMLPAGGTTTRLRAIAETIETGCSADASAGDARPTDAGAIDAAAGDAAQLDAGHDAGIDAGHDAGNDAASTDAGRPACATTFGGVGGFVLCTETAVSCRFFAQTGGHDCDALCTSHGSSCIAEENDDSSGAACDSLGASSCGNDGTDAICTCAR
jgi:hypothetical protein